MTAFPTDVPPSRMGMFNTQWHEVGTQAPHSSVSRSAPQRKELKMMGFFLRESPYEEGNHLRRLAGFAVPARRVLKTGFDLCKALLSDGALSHLRAPRLL